jgi:hypothetical protein
LIRNGKKNNELANAFEKEAKDLRGWILSSKWTSPLPPST